MLQSDFSVRPSIEQVLESKILIDYVYLLAKEGLIGTDYLLNIPNIDKQKLAEINKSLHSKIDPSPNPIIIKLPLNPNKVPIKIMKNKKLFKSFNIDKSITLVDFRIAL